jgi:hypothetical protein
MKMSRMGRLWVYTLKGMDMEESLANADRDIEEMREKDKKEALEAWDLIS